MLRFEWGAAKATLPEQVVSMTELLFEQIAGLEREIRSRTRSGEEMKRLMTIPDIGSICAMAANAFRHRWRASVADATLRPGSG